MGRSLETRGHGLEEEKRMVQKERMMWMSKEPGFQGSRGYVGSFLCQLAKVPAPQLI